MKQDGDKGHGSFESEWGGRCEGREVRWLLGTTVQALCFPAASQTETVFVTWQRDPCAIRPTGCLLIRITYYLRERIHSDWIRLPISVSICWDMKITLLLGAVFFPSQSHYSCYSNRGQWVLQDRVCWREGGCQPRVWTILSGPLQSCWPVLQISPGILTFWCGIIGFPKKPLAKDNNWESKLSLSG